MEPNFAETPSARTFGYTAAEAIGQGPDLIIPATLRERHWRGYRERMRMGRPNRFLAKPS